MSEPKLTREQIEEWRTALLNTYKQAGHYAPAAFAQAMTDIGILCDMALLALSAEADARVPVEPDDCTLACVKAAINEVDGKDGARVHIRHARAAYAAVIAYGKRQLDAAMEPR